MTRSGVLKSLRYFFQGVFDGHHIGVDQMQPSTIRQLEEVWQLKAGAQGAGSCAVVRQSPAGSGAGRRELGLCLVVMRS
jgi:hypothetical protein